MIIMKVKISLSPSTSYVDHAHTVYVQIFEEYKFCDVICDMA